MKLINAKEVVNKLKQGGAADISEAYFGKLVSMGKIPFHTTPGKKRKMFIYAEAKKGLIESRDPSRDAQREAIALAKINKRLLNGEIDHSTATDEVKAIEEIVNAGILTDEDMPIELVELLSEIVDPSKALHISKEFWTAKIQKQKFLKENRDLISVGDAKAVIEMFLSPISSRLDTLHIELKSHFPDTTPEAVAWLSTQINDMKESMQNQDFGEK